ncbi:MAG: porin family protein [Cyclobacteriaceae bacterium]|nr:porin family protein [Cyclobacteriaceae bacterium]
MLKKYALGLTLVFLFCEFADAQSFYRRNRKTGYTVSVGLGTASYHGDLKSSQINFDLKGAANVGIEVPVKGRLNIRGEFMWYRISDGEDKTIDSEDKFFVRNLSFNSSNFDLSVMGIFQITPNSPRPRTDLTTYAIAGIGGTYYNPKAELNGTDYKLRPLMTEGVDYGEIAFVIPVGAGASVRLNYDWSIGLEAIYRFTTTDFLDDVSDVYVDNASFSDPIAQQLADRRPEAGLGVRPAGFKRGDPDNNDGYLVIMAKVNYHLNQGLYYKRKRNRRSKIFRRR